MKLTDLRPCAGCGGQINKGGNPVFYVVRASQAVLNPGAISRAMGGVQMVGGHFGIADALGMTGGDEIAKIVGDEPDGKWTELQFCQDCYLSGDFSMADATENHKEKMEELQDRAKKRAEEEGDAD